MIQKSNFLTDITVILKSRASLCVWILCTAGREQQQTGDSGVSVLRQYSLVKAPGCRVIIVCLVTFKIHHTLVSRGPLTGQECLPYGG